MKFAYADPPYLGQSRRYKDDPKCCEVNHRVLIQHLSEYDAWALSLSSPTLKTILNLCPDNVRVGGWFKSFCSFKPNVNPAYCWEPVIFKVGRGMERFDRTVRDYVECPITLQIGMCGAKPEAFCFWLFELLNAKPDDEFTDLFPGSGNVWRSWMRWSEIKRLNPKVDVGAYLEDQEYQLWDQIYKGGDGK